MRTMGIIRRIDDLGRVAIPKEIRIMMGIKAGDPLEFFINENEKAIILKSWKPMKVTREDIIAMFETLTREEQNEFLLDLRDLIK